jgi:transketolase
MRRSFIKTLTELAERDARILFLTGDLGYTAVEPFAEKFPARFFNVGVAEQNMVGVATGLAEAGFIPFVYSIATFASLRPYEFIRNGPVAHKLPVRIVGVGGGVEYGSAGATHHALEDIGAMRLQPGLTVISPADHQQAGRALLATWDCPGPIYYRIGKDDTATVPGLRGRFELGGAQLIRKGNDLLMISMGSVTTEVADAAEKLAALGITCTVLVVASLCPTPVTDLTDALVRFPIVITVENHYLTGGLASLVAEIIAQRELRCRLMPCGVKAVPSAAFGSQNYLRHAHGLSSQALVDTALKSLNETRV